MIGIGIDTGGTYTDAVVYDLKERKVLSAGKALTTKTHLEEGIGQALDALDQELVKQAELLALSTTLATNACVEDKGSRAKILFIGLEQADQERLADVYESYGFHDPGQLIFLDGKPEGIYKEPKEPDWETFQAQAAECFGDCAAVGTVQIYPRSNGGRFEKEAEKRLKETLQIPVTTAYELFAEDDILKRGAGTLLNARLIPLIDEFLQAVGHVLKERNLAMPITIVRSDGSQMSELLAKECPVETLLSGPAASAVGGSVLAGEPDAVIVDMGGTTTDTALVRQEKPVMADQGIYIGKWKTMVKGMYVKTFALGGDSAVRFRGGRLYMDDRRVIPLSLLGKEHPEIVQKLKKLSEKQRMHTRMLHEFYVLQKDIAGKHGYTDEEYKICQALKEGPLMAEGLAERIGSEIYFLDTRRLEEEEVLMKSGLTPTDMMVLKGDFSIYPKEAAQAALGFVSRNVGMEAEQIPDAVYDLVEEKMYCSIARILMEQKYPKNGKLLGEESVDQLLKWSYEDAKARTGEEKAWMRCRITTDLPIVGAGAPIHIFLPRVAALLGTEAVVPKFAEVANAIGAIAGQVAAKVQIRIKAEYDGAAFSCYSVYEGTSRHTFEKYAPAEAFALEAARRAVKEKAIRQGSSENPRIQVEVKKIRSESALASIFFESIVEASAYDEFQA